MISRETSQEFKGLKECLSIRDMVLIKNWPAAKIAGIVTKNKGTPDPDAPSSLELTTYWVATTKTMTDRDRTAQRSETEIQAETSSAGVAALMGSNMPGPGSVSISQQQLDAITASTAPPPATSEG